MHKCFQTEGLSIHAHGQMVLEHYLDLLKNLRSDSPAKAPLWLFYDKDLVFKKLLPLKIVEEYLLMHDCGKPFGKQIDKNGKTHFPDHAAVSASIFKEVFKGESKELITELISEDMTMHKIKADELASFAKRDISMTLLLASLAEISANAEMFGGKESVSYKIKYKHLERRGRALLKIWKIE